MKKVLSFLLSLFVMFSAVAFPHIEAVAEDMQIEINETFSDDDILSADSTITPEEPGDGGGTVVVENNSNNFYIKNTSSIYLGKNASGMPIGSTTAGYNRYKWQLVENSDGTYHIINADSTVENEVPYKFALSCSASGVISLEAYAISDEKQKWEINTVTVSNSVYNTIESYNGYFLNILSSGGVSAATVVCLNIIVQCSNTAQMTSDTKDYIDKINNSGLLTQMNCYAYALGVYNKYEPILDDMMLGLQTIYYWRFPSLQMGDIAGSGNDFESVFNNSDYYTSDSNGARTLNSSGRIALTNIIIDAVEADLYEMYSYSGGLIPTTNDAVCLSDWRKIALVIDTEGVIIDSAGACKGGYDHHWYVQHEDGTWTHKPGVTEATAYDANNLLITDPATAARGSYNYFAGYYMIRCDYVLNNALNGISSTTYQNDGAGDIPAHAYSSAVEIPTTYSKLFTGKIEYGTGDLWEPNFEIDGCEYTYIYYNHGTYWVKKRLNYETGETTYISTIEASSSAEVSNTERAQYYVSKSVSNTHSDSSALPCDVDFYEFSVSQTGNYKIYTEYKSSSEQLDTFGVLYRNNIMIYSNDNGNGDYGNNFCITAYLTAGEMYIVSVKASDRKNTGEYKLYISYQG